jgi:ferredoxin
MWREYDTRCINCGRCNFVCPTCTCFTMQDLYYSENGRVGERRRIWASCMVDGFTDVAGGGSYRQKNGDRMRFKVLHKVLDFREAQRLQHVRRLRQMRRHLSGIHIIFRLYQQAGNDRQGGERKMKNEYIPFVSRILDVTRHTDIEYTFRMAYDGSGQARPVL